MTMPRQNANKYRMTMETNLRIDNSFVTCSVRTRSEPIDLRVPKVSTSVSLCDLRLTIALRAKSLTA